MRKTALFLAIVMIALPLVSCGSSDANENEDGLYVIATIFPQYDFARSILGDLGQVEMLLAPKTESHTFEPSMTDIAKISRSDLFIYTGGGIDLWAENIMANLDKQGTKSIAISHFVSELCHSDEECDHDEHGEESCIFDEHVWTSPKNAILIFNGILFSVKNNFCLLRIFSSFYF